MAVSQARILTTWSIWVAGDAMSQLDVSSGSMCTQNATEKYGGLVSISEFSASII